MESHLLRLKVLTLTELLCEAVLSFFFHFDLKFIVCALEFLFNLSLQDNLSSLIIVMLTAEVERELTWVIPLEYLNAFNSACFATIRVHLDEE